VSVRQLLGAVSVSGMLTSASIIQGTAELGY
jgi:hypothetical protein